MLNVHELILLLKIFRYFCVVVSILHSPVEFVDIFGARINDILPPCSTAVLLVTGDIYSIPTRTALIKYASCGSLGCK